MFRKLWYYRDVVLLYTVIMTCRSIIRNLNEDCSGILERPDGRPFGIRRSPDKIIHSFLIWRMLKGCGHAAQLFLGADKQGGPIRGHAWVQRPGQMRMNRTYQVLAVYQ